MKHYFLFILLSAAIATGGCTEELQPQTCGTNGTVPDESELTEAVLNLSVNAFVVEAQAETRASIPSGTPEKETPEEKEIHNIWVFQYVRFDTPPEANPARQSEPKRETRPTADWPLGLQHSCPPGKNGYLRAKILRKADFSAVARGNKATPDLLPDLISDLESAMDKKKFSLSIPLISCLLLAGRM